MALIKIIVGLPSRFPGGDYERREVAIDDGALFNEVQDTFKLTEAERLNPYIARASSDGTYTIYNSSSVPPSLTDAMELLFSCPTV